MGTVTIQNYTTKNPISLIGEQAGVCWGANTSDALKNYNRGLDCLKSGHGRTFEFPDVYMVLDGYSARVIREFYTHIGGLPTRLQASTRYIDYKDFEYVIPSNIETNTEAKKVYENCISDISFALVKLEELGIPREDSALLLPLAMGTKVVVKMNLRTLIDMSHQRKCSRAYHEFRKLFSDIESGLKDYSQEWADIVDGYFMPKCEYLGYCPEKNPCPRSHKFE
jgi:thymidylate synthase (FAD)